MKKVRSAVFLHYGADKDDVGNMLFVHDRWLQEQPSLEDLVERISFEGLVQVILGNHETIFKGRSNRKTGIRDLTRSNLINPPGPCTNLQDDEISHQYIFYKYSEPIKV